MIRVLALLAAVLAAAFAVQGSQATFTASAVNSASTFTTVSDWAAPAVTLTAPANGASTNDTTPTLSGAAGNMTGDSHHRHRAASTAARAPRARRCRRAPPPAPAPRGRRRATALAAGTYTAQATQTDTAGNTGTSTANTFTVDTTKPSAAGIVAANKAGGTAGKIENGDTLTFTYSEPITAASVWAGWNGASTAVNVRFTNGHGRHRHGRDRHHGHRQARHRRDQGELRQRHHDLRVDHGALGRRRVDRRHPRHARQRAATAVTAKNMTWTPVVGITDLAGNTSTAATAFTETDTDVDF